MKSLRDRARKLFASMQPGFSPSRRALFGLGAGAAMAAGLPASSPKALSADNAAALRAGFLMAREVRLGELVACGPIRIPVSELKDVGSLAWTDQMMPQLARAMSSYRSLMPPSCRTSVATIADISAPASSGVSSTDDAADFIAPASSSYETRPFSINKFAIAPNATSAAVADAGTKSAGSCGDFSLIERVSSASASGDARAAGECESPAACRTIAGGAA